MYEGRDEAAQTRPNIRTAPTRFDTAVIPKLGPNEQLRIFDGARILIATAVPEAIERFRLSLRELGAQVLVHHPLEDSLEAAAPLDPQVVLLDRESLKGRSTQFFRTLHGDPRLRWASVVRVNASELTQVQVGTLETLAARLKPKLIADAKLTGLARQERPFLLRLSRLGPNRVLRALDSVSGAVRITTTAQRTLSRLDIQGGEILGAHFKAVARPETLNGLQALAAFLAQEEGEVRIEQRDRLTLHNIALPITEAIDRACNQLESVAEVLGNSALLEARAHARPFALTRRFDRSKLNAEEAEELDDGAIEFVTYDEDEHTRRVDNPTAVLGPPKSEPPKSRSTPPPIPSTPPAARANSSLRPAAPSNSPVSSVPPAAPPIHLAKSVTRIPQPLRAAPTQSGGVSNPSRANRDAIARTMPRLEVPSSSTERPASSSTVKIRLETQPKKSFDALRFAAFALACIALGFVMTTAIRILFVDEQPEVALTATQPPAPTTAATTTMGLESANQGTFDDQKPTAPPKTSPRGDDTVRIEPRPSQATTVVPPKRPAADDNKQRAQARTRAQIDPLTKLAEAAAASSTPVDAQPSAAQPGPLTTDPSTADYRRANRLIAAGNIEQAIEEMSLLLKSNPSDHRAMANIASANLKAGQTQEAIRWAKKAVGVRPTDASYQNLLGDALGLMGEREQALVHWTEAKRLKSENVAPEND